MERAETIYRLIENVILEHNLSGSALDDGAGTGELVERLRRLNCFSQIAGAGIMKPPQLQGGPLEWFEQDLKSPLACGDGSSNVLFAAESN